MPQFVTHADIIEYLTSAWMANTLELAPANIRMMKHRRSIPSVYWPMIVAAANAQGHDCISWEVLAQTQPPQKNRVKSRAEPAAA